MTSTEVVQFSEQDTSSGHVLALATLNEERTLNSLSLDMVRLLQQALNDWAERDDVVAVIIQGAGDRALCAGGDIQALYRAIVANHEAGKVVDEYPFNFFAEEYRLDYTLHTYPKPVVTIGHGIVMGGGMGIFGASSHRVLTETSRLAFPEITIGLFPDAGGTWSLGHMAPHWASFLGMTGSNVNAADAMLCGWGDCVIAQSERQTVVAELHALHFTQDPEDNGALINDFLQGQIMPSLPPAELNQVPERDIRRDDLAAEVAELNALAGRSKWIDRGLANLQNGCPTTAGIVHEQLRRVGDLTLADSFRLEVTVGTHCATNTDFREGVRALLIDKDNAPQWRYGSIAELPDDYVQSHFEAPWAENPLADLD